MCLIPLLVPLGLQSPKKWLAPALVLLRLQTIFSAPVVFDCCYCSWLNFDLMMISHLHVSGVDLAAAAESEPLPAVRQPPLLPDGPGVREPE